MKGTHDKNKNVDTYIAILDVTLIPIRINIDILYVGL